MNKDTVTRILLADDDHRVRWALRQFIEHEFHACIVSEVSTASDLLSHIELFNPDLILLDWDLPRSAGACPLATIRALYPNIKIIALTGGFTERQTIMATGIHTAINKLDPPERLLAVLDESCNRITTHP